MVTAVSGTVSMQRQCLVVGEDSVTDDEVDDDDEVILPSAGPIEEGG